MGKRLFWRFNAHDTGTFVRWDNKHIVYKPTCEDRPEQRVMMQAECMSEISREDYTPGTPIRLQFGEASRWTSQVNGGTRFESIKTYGGRYKNIRVDAYVGCHCVTAISHAKPRIALLSLHAMLDELGVEETLVHLQNFADGASTLQKEISLARWRKDYGASSFTIEKGLLLMNRRLADRLRVEGRRLIFWADLPESLLLALPGRPLSTILNHDVTRDPRLIIGRIDVDGDRKFAWTNEVVDINEAIAIVETLQMKQPLAA